MAKLHKMNPSPHKSATRAIRRGIILGAVALSFGACGAARGGPTAHDRWLDACWDSAPEEMSAEEVRRLCDPRP